MNLYLIQMKTVSLEYKSQGKKRTRLSIMY